MLWAELKKRVRMVPSQSAVATLKAVPLEVALRPSLPCPSQTMVATLLLAICPTATSWAYSTGVSSVIHKRLDYDNNQRYFVQYRGTKKKKNTNHESTERTCHCEKELACVVNG
jgi:hypothetical protein